MLRTQRARAHAIVGMVAFAALSLILFGRYIHIDPLKSASLAKGIKLRAGPLAGRGPSR